MQDRATNIDTRAVNHLVATPQATHASAVCSSVGMALRTLLNTYYRGRLNLEDLNETAYRAYNARITDGSEHVFLELPDNAARRLIDTEYQTCFNDFRERANTPQQLGALDSLDAQVKQPMFRDHHIINLYLPVRDAADAAYVDKIYVFPLKLVFTLVWKALRDHAKFTHNYTEGNDQAKLNKASAEYKDRLASLFRCIDDLVKNPICATGYRNELVFLLSQTYEGMELIESVLGTVALVLRHTVNHLFREKFAVATEQTQKRTLSSALLRWIGEADNTILLPMLGSRTLYQWPLQTIFIKHGINPHAMNLDGLINDALPTLNFAFGPEYPALKTLTAILQSFEVNAPPARSAALAAMQQWIYDNSVIDEKVEGVENFYKLYAAQKALEQHRILLVTLSQMKAEFQTVAASCDQYFLDYVAAMNSNNALPVVAQDVLATIELLNATITLCRENDLKNTIENFFGVWFATTTVTDLKIAYAMLLDEDIQEKIILSDEEIDSYLALLGEPLPNGEAPEIYPYQINMVLLNGIIKKPQQWSEEFKNLFLLVIDFLHKNLNENDQPNQHATTLQSSSYPPRLMNQLHYLHSVAGGAPIERPSNMILLPDQVETTEEWSDLSNAVDHKILHELYDLYKVVLIHRAKNNTNVPIRTFLETIPKAARLSFLIETGWIEVVKQHLERYPTWVVRYLNLLPEEDRDAFLRLANIENFGAQFTTKTLIDELLNFDPKDRFALITSSPCMTYLQEHLVPEDFDELISILLPTDIPLFLAGSLSKDLFRRWCELLVSPFDILIKMQCPPEHLPIFLNVPEVIAYLRQFFWENQDDLPAQKTLLIVLYKCLKEDARETFLTGLGTHFTVFYGLAGMKRLLPMLTGEINKVEALTTKPCANLLLEYFKNATSVDERLGRAREIATLLNESEQAEFFSGKFYGEYIKNSLNTALNRMQVLSYQLIENIPYEFKHYFIRGNITYVKSQLAVLGEIRDFTEVTKLVMGVIPEKRSALLLEDLGVEYLQNVFSVAHRLREVVETLPARAKPLFLGAIAKLVAAYPHINDIEMIMNCLYQDDEKFSFAYELCRHREDKLSLLHLVPEVYRLGFLTNNSHFTIEELKGKFQSGHDIGVNVLAHLPERLRASFFKDTLGLAFVATKIFHFNDIAEIFFHLPEVCRYEVITGQQLLECIRKLTTNYLLLIDEAPITALVEASSRGFLSVFAHYGWSRLFLLNLNLSSHQVIKILHAFIQDQSLDPRLVHRFIEKLPVATSKPIVNDFIFSYQRLHESANYGPLNWLKSDWVTKMDLKNFPPSPALKLIFDHAREPSRTQIAWSLLRKLVTHEPVNIIAADGINLRS